MIRALAQLDDTILASGSNDNTVRLWNLTTMASIANFTDHSDHVNALISFSLNNQNYLISGSNDKTTKIWNSSGLVKNIPGESQVNALAYVSNILSMEFNDRIIFNEYFLA